MRRKAIIIGIVTILLSAVGAESSPVYNRVVSSVRSVTQNFGDLQKAESMNSVERFVFSLVLANSKAPATAANIYSGRTGRT
ncbi:MAG: hypothetical protein ABI806_11160 [Candidatus Solibacter sp.]